MCVIDCRCWNASDSCPLPSYNITLPPLTYDRHISISSLRDTITRTVQLFKRTHQDR